MAPVAGVEISPPADNSEEKREMVSPVKELVQLRGPFRTAPNRRLRICATASPQLANEVADIAERRTRAIRAICVDTAEAGASELRRTIRRQPGLPWRSPRRQVLFWRSS